jgi:hypothetical protein
MASTKVTPKKITTSSTADKKLALKGILGRYETAQLEKAKLVQKHQELFEKLAELDDVMNECQEAAKRLVFSKGGPPKDDPANMRKQTWRAANGQFYRIKVTYSKHADYYDPSALPEDILTRPGVVTEVDTEAVAALDDERAVNALRIGAWQTPRLSIVRIDKDKDVESDGEDNLTMDGEAS